MQLTDRYGKELEPIYKYEFQPVSGYKVTIYRKGNFVDIRFYGILARNQGYQSLGNVIPQGFRPVQDERCYFDNIVGTSTNGTGFWNISPSGELVSFSTTSNSVEKVSNMIYLTNDPMPSDSYLMEE